MESIIVLFPEECVGTYYNLAHRIDDRCEQKPVIPVPTDSKKKSYKKSSRGLIYDEYLAQRQEAFGTGYTGFCKVTPSQLTKTNRKGTFFFSVLNERNK